MSVLTPYAPLDHVVPHWGYRNRDEALEDENTNGKILIQYDPMVAMEQKAGWNCPGQAAGVEVWFEETGGVPRYRDIWPALPDQILDEEMGSSRRLLRGRQVMDVDEQEWQTYADVLRRQNGVCAQPSIRLSTSPTAQDPTTLQTSISNTSGGGDSTYIASSTVDQPPATTDEPQTSTDASESEPTPNPPPKSKALSIVLR